MLTLTCLLEEQSARELLQNLLPRILPNEISIKYIVFQGKRDLKRDVEKKLRGWNTPNTVFLILLDQDRENCITLKKEIMQKAVNAGKAENTCVRIACRELESFYLGDLEALEKALKLTKLAKLQDKKEYRDPDNLGRKPSEALMKISKRKYSKVKSSRILGTILDIDEKNRSKSYKQLLLGVKKITNVSPSSGSLSESSHHLAY